MAFARASRIWALSGDFEKPLKITYYMGKKISA